MSRWGGYRELLGNRRFLLYEASATAASVGYSVYAVSVPWLALDLSGGLLLVGLVLLAEYGAYTLTFLVAPWVDRARNKRTVFLACYPAQALAAAAIGWGLVDHRLGPGLLLVLVAGISFLWDFAWAAYNVVPRLLLSQDQLFRAQGLGGIFGGATQLGGFAGGAALVVLVGPAGGMWLYAALLAGGTAIAATVSLPSAGPAPARPSYRAEFLAGWRHFARRAERSLLPLGASELLRGFFVAAPALLITLVAARSLGGSAAGYGVLFVAFVVGGVAAGVLLGELNPRRTVGALLPVAAAVEGVALLGAVAFAARVLPAALLWAVVGAAGTVYLTSAYTFLYGAFPPGELARISANLYLFTGLASSAGAFLLGELASAGSAWLLGGVVGVGYLALAALVASVPSIRRLAF